METCIEWTDDGMAWVSSDQQRIINELHRLKAERPGEVDIRAEPNANDGSIYATVPVSWVKIRPPKQLTEEQRIKATAVLREARERRENQG